MTITSNDDQSSRYLKGVVRFAIALGLTGLLLVFLVISHWSFTRQEVLTLRNVTSIESVSVPAPPPPPVTNHAPPPPPPPSAMELPKLDLTVDHEAPPLQATMAERLIDLTMKPAEFATEFQPPKAATLYSAAQLDTQPRLLNRPQVAFPPSQSRLGVKEGRVTLEVMINTSGQVMVRRIVSSSHADFAEMAKQFASQSRFSPPRKDDRIVNAVFNWPLVLRP